MKSNKQVLLIIACSLVCATRMVAQQSGMQSWNGLGLDIEMGEKFELGFHELISLVPSNGFGMNFEQTGISLQFKATPILYFEAGDQLNVIPSSTRPVRNRIYARGMYALHFSELFRSTHGLQFEVHDKNELRYDERLILINGISTKKRYTVAHLRPSVSYWLYYNIGGDPVQYYNADGTNAISQPATGFHRGRLYLSVNSRLSDHFNIGLYFMNQREFNLFTPEFREINVLDPNSGNITRGFSNYNVLGVSLNFRIGNN